MTMAYDVAIFEAPKYENQLFVLAHIANAYWTVWSLSHTPPNANWL